MELTTAWAARCCCYNGHNSNSGRCNCRNDGHEHAPLLDPKLGDPKLLPNFGEPYGVYDPTRKAGDHTAICSYCREHCKAK